MCTGLEVALLASAATSAGAAVYTATQGQPKPPAPQQQAVAPGMDAFRNRTRQGRSPAQAAALASGNIARSELSGTMATGNRSLGS